jgi:hypothetical protein
MTLEGHIELTDSDLDHSSPSPSPSHSNEGRIPPLRAGSPVVQSAAEASRILRPSGISKRALAGLTFSELIHNPSFMELHEQKMRLQERVWDVVERIMDLENLCDSLEVASALFGSLVPFFFLMPL